ncbi:MAG: HAMP domain-containing histidine kinase [Clostridiales bacterium]|nr:HAMP domain-containing histidine kinase [Clostridiales bacterium]
MGKDKYLPIARAIILAHNGKIKFYSKEGQGTTVEIYLPKAKLTHS